jgi:hypothetical protein
MGSGGRFPLLLSVALQGYKARALTSTNTREAIGALYPCLPQLSHQQDQQALP